MKKNYLEPKISVESMENNLFICRSPDTSVGSGTGTGSDVSAGSNERRTGWDTVFGED